MAAQLLRFLLLMLVITCASAQTMVYDCVDLQNMKNNLAGNYALANDVDCSDTVNWNGGDGFEPVGWYEDLSSHDAFDGTFHGQGFQISGLFINRPATSRSVGLFGYSAGEIHFVGLVGGSVQGLEEVGSLAGRNTGVITNSYATSTVKGSDGFIGGLVGYNRDNLTNVYATGVVIGIGQGANAVGGLVGLNHDGIITNAYATGNVTGYRTVGGLVGSSENGILTNVYATGSVSGSDDDIGGLVGYLRANLNQDYAESGYEQATIANAYALGGASGKDDVGGLIGELVGEGLSNILTSIYATGCVRGQRVGGLIGGSLSSDYVSDAYWDAQVTHQSKIAGRTSNFKLRKNGKTTQEMYQQASYEGWDFVNTWDIDEGNSYPYLRALVPADLPIAPTGDCPQPSTDAATSVRITVAVIGVFAFFAIVERVVRLYKKTGLGKFLSDYFQPLVGYLFEMADKILDIFMLQVFFENLQDDLLVASIALLGFSYLVLLVFYCFTKRYVALLILPVLSPEYLLLLGESPENKFFVRSKVSNFLIEEVGQFVIGIVFLVRKGANPAVLVKLVFSFLVGVLFVLKLFFPDFFSKLKCVQAIKQKASGLCGGMHSSRGKETAMA